MKFVSCLFAVFVLSAQSATRLVYSKSFPGSVPPFVAITLARDGTAEYKEAPDDENPLRFRLPQAQADEIFALVEKLDGFRKPLESPMKVAFMGTKTFRLEDGARTAEVKFNYSEDANAQLLADWFERMTESAMLLINLERAARYDKLGVQRAVLQLETAMDRKRVVAAEQFLPMLDRIAKNETYMNAARARAAYLAEVIRAPKP